MGRRTVPQGPDDPVEECNHYMMTLFECGYERGVADWRVGIHVDPFIPADGEWTETLEAQSHGWAAGQDRFFVEAADQFDALMRKHSRY